MKKSLLANFREYNKWGDIINLNLMECQVSLILTLVILIILGLLDVRGHYKCFETAFQNIVLYISAALIGMIGIILAGIAIIIGVLNKEIKVQIEKANGADSIERILTSFAFLTFIIGLQIVMFFMIYIALYSPNKVFPTIMFYCSIGLISYLFLFTIFYTVSLVGNCIKLYIIANTYSDIIYLDKNIYTKANEIRIDFILHSLLQGETKQEFLDKLYKFIDESRLDNKEQLKKYLNEYYKV